MIQRNNLVVLSKLLIHKKEQEAKIGKIIELELKVGHGEHQNYDTLILELLFKETFPFKDFEILGEPLDDDNFKSRTFLILYK